MIAALSIQGPPWLGSRRGTVPLHRQQNAPGAKPGTLVDGAALLLLRLHRRPRETTALAGLLASPGVTVGFDPTECGPIEGLGFQEVIKPIFGGGMVEPGIARR